MNPTDLTKEQLIEMVKQLKQRKKFGLVWEDKPENVVEHVSLLEPNEKIRYRRAISFCFEINKETKEEQEEGIGLVEQKRSLSASHLKMRKSVWWR